MTINGILVTEMLAAYEGLLTLQQGTSEAS
jgi:hypothetical protein